MGKERRKHARFAATAFLNTPIRLAPIPPFFGSTVRGMLIDLSAGGMSVVVEESLPLNTRFDLAITFPDGIKIECVIQIARVIPRGKKFFIGMEFLNLPGPMAYRIEKMSQDYIDCEQRIQNQSQDICRADCAFYSMCCKPMKLQPVFNFDSGLDLVLRTLQI